MSFYLLVCIGSKISAFCHLHIPNFLFQWIFKQLFLIQHGLLLILCSVRNIVVRFSGVCGSHRSFTRWFAKQSFKSMNRRTHMRCPIWNQTTESQATHFGKRAIFFGKSLSILSLWWVNFCCWNYWMLAFNKWQFLQVTLFSHSKWSFNSSV